MFPYEINFIRIKFYEKIKYSKETNFKLLNEVRN